MTMRSRELGAALAAAALVVLLCAAPALAASKQGTQNCGSSYHVWIHSESTGTTKHWAPTGTLWQTYNNGIVLQTRTTGTTLNNSSWKVSTDMYLYTPNTFAFCYF